MKNILTYTCSLLLSILSLSCQEEKLSKESVIIDDTTVQNDFDIWLKANYTDVYNINVIYRADDREYDIDYTLSPPDIAHSIAIAKILQYLWFGTYNDVKGILFTKTYIPKVIVLMGSGMYNSTSVVVGEAEGGLKITFAKINDLDIDNLTLEDITGGSTYSGSGTETTGLIKTAFHEFSHILTQTTPLPEEFSLVSANDYLGDDWNTSGTTPLQAWTAGFPSKYASSSPSEDFAEIVSIYITRGSDNWASLQEAAGDDGAEILNTKVDMINSYLSTYWNTSLDAMREAFAARAAHFDEIDLVNL